MSKHTVAINVLTDELERILRNVVFIQKCLRSIEKQQAYLSRPAITEAHTLRLNNSLKNQIKSAEKITAAIKVLERDI